ncbi:uncharacterized protein METZ01_LOCUS60040 [marine metagenome]|uniref:Uncharacterized protein n=1 Tax=marine metagenome TaxID=408172 RepID=A0A381ST78_9ZZZZ
MILWSEIGGKGGTCWEYFAAVSGLQGNLLAEITNPPSNNSAPA